MKKAIFAMGCFWQPQYIFEKIKGVIKTRVGYIGGDKKIKNPTYEQVCSDTTGYAEAIEITFDQSIVSYDQLLDLFWTNHDPTTMDRQGPDVGSQYRSAIFYLDENQKEQALKSRDKWSKRLIDSKLKIVTEITKSITFYPAEDYHQNFLDKNNRVCHIAKRVFR